MNFEKFYRLVCSNWDALPNKKQTLLYLCYHYDLLLWKRKKLKLGAIVFIIKEYKFDEVLLWEEAEIKFINQDTTLEDERSLEAIFKKLAWEWNARSYIALGVVVLIGLSKISRFIKAVYRSYLPTLAFRNDFNDYLVKCGFEEAYNYHSIGVVAEAARPSFWLIEVLSDFAIYYNIIL